MKIRERIQVKYKILKGPTLLFSHKPFTKAIPLLFFWNHRLNHHGNTHHLFYLFFFFVPQNSAPLSPAREAAVLRHLPSSFTPSYFYVLCLSFLKKRKKKENPFWPEKEMEEEETNFGRCLVVLRRDSGEQENEHSYYVIFIALLPFVLIFLSKRNF